MKRLSWILAVLLLAVGSVRADEKTAVMVPPRVEAGIPEDLVLRAVEQLRRELERSADHFTVITHGQAVAIAEADQSNSFDRPKGEPDAIKCVNADCAVWFRRVVNADLAVQLSILNRVDERKRLLPSSLTIVLLEDAEARWAGSASLVDDSVEDAVRQAFDEASAKRRKGVGPWISVYGSPIGASVQLDEAPIGRIPLERFRIEDSASLHVLTVSQPGFKEYRRTLEMGGDISKEEMIQVALQRGTGQQRDAVADGSGSGARRRERRDVSLWQAVDYGLAAVLVAAGAVNLGYGARNWHREDTCRVEQGGVCLERYGVPGDGVSGATLAMTIAGGAAILAGAAIAIWRPVYRFKARGSAHSAYVAFEGRF
jgi:hypothetical protein